MTLAEYFSAHPRAALAFSGGVDSAYLLWAGRHYGCDLTAYYVHTAFQPEFEFRDAQRLAKEVGVPMVVVEADILALPLAAANGPDRCYPLAAANGPDRCYHCKKALFTKLWETARQDGHTLLLDGTNASDDAGDRPGMKALRELAVESPLRLCGLTKADVRAASKEAGLFTWDKPRPMPAWPPASPPAGPSPGRTWNGWKKRRTPSSPWDSPTSGFGSWPTPPASSCRRGSGRRPWA